MLDANNQYQQYGFEKLEVYQHAEDLVVKIYNLAKKFPKEELFGLTSQIRRASVSVALNLAEGSVERTKKEFIKFTNTAIGSLVETKSALRIGVKLGIMEQKDFEEVLPLIDKIFFKILALKKSLNK
ncbi:MAG: four helix bundle protein [Patescibacteria group bacterium]